MRLLMLSWRYIDHPAAGGAEHVTHEVLARLARDGHDVTCFTASHPAAAAEGEIDGVRLIRRGGQATVHFQAWRWLRRRQASFDRIVDQVNTIPFLTPLYVSRERRRLYVNQLAREYWFRETRGPLRALAPLGYLVEPWYMRVYRSTPAITISRSTADDLAALGIGRARIHLVPMAVTLAPVPSLEPKRAVPWRLIVLGRLTPAKFVEEALAAFAIVRLRVGDARLDVVGGGDPAYRRRLEAWTAARGLEGVIFHGRVDEERKRALLLAAHTHVFCSHREGWGLTVSEAAAAGVPSVGYDVPGVRDSIADPRLLAPRGDVEGLAARVIALREDAELYAQLREEAWDRSRSTSVEDMTAAFAEALGIAWPDAAGTPRGRRRPARA